MELLFLMKIGILIFLYFFYFFHSFFLKFNLLLRVLTTCNLAGALMLKFHSPSELMKTFSRFDEIIQPICRFGVEIAEAMGGLGGGKERKEEDNEEWELELENMLMLAAKGFRISFFFFFLSAIFF